MATWSTARRHRRPPRGISLVLTATLAGALGGGVAFGQESEPASGALESAQEASRALRRAHETLLAWSARKDTVSSLLRGGPNGRTWAVSSTAARLYPALVLAAWMTDGPLHDGLLRETLRDETRLTGRVGPLPDDYGLDERRFVSATTDADAIVDNAAAYACGLSLIVQMEGPGPWADRLRAVVDGIFLRAAVRSPHAEGPLPSENAATNGTLLRLLPLVAALVDDEGYLYYARRIADAYCTDVMPRNGGLPADRWNFADERPRTSGFSLDAGGLALVQGLTLLYAIEAQRQTERAGVYRPAVAGMVDRLLSRALNADGSFTRRIQPDGRGGYGLDRRHRSPCGAGLLATVHLFGTLTGNERHVSAVKALVDRGAAFTDDPSGDVPGLFSLHAQVAQPGKAGSASRPAISRLLTPDKGRSLDEAADADLLRALLSFAWFHTAGVRAVPWRDDLLLGARLEGSELRVVLRAGRAWTGRLLFDRRRSPGLLDTDSPGPFDQGLPEWFAVDSDADYRIRIQDATGPAVWSGSLLGAGLPVQLPSDATIQLTIRPLSRAARP